MAVVPLPLHTSSLPESKTLTFIKTQPINKSFTFVCGLRLDELNRQMIIFMVSIDNLKNGLRSVVEEMNAISSSGFYSKSEKVILLRRVRVRFDRLSRMINFLELGDLDVKERMLYRDKDMLLGLLEKYDNLDYYRQWLEFNRSEFRGKSVRKVYEDRFLVPLREKLDFVLTLLGERDIR